MYTQTRRHWLWFCHGVGSGSRALQEMLTRGVDANEVWASPEAFRDEMQAGQFDRLMQTRSETWIDDCIARIEKCGARVIFQTEEDFPDSLRFIPDPPSLLFVRGTLPGVERHVVGIVGTRRPSRDGMQSAFEIAKCLSDNGVAVVSGLAAGIDTAAHTGCLRGRSPTVAVLGHGPDRCYPAENAALSQEIVDTGGALATEYFPDSEVFSSQFARRDRLISGFASGTLLVEGEERSGAMITLRNAKEQGRVRFALPGSVRQLNAAAPNSLLKDGAVPIVDGEDILRYLGWMAEKPKKETKKAVKEKKTPPMESTEAKIYDLLRAEDLSFGELAQGSGMDAAHLATTLTLMEMKGLISALPGKMYRIRQ